MTEKEQPNQPNDKLLDSWKEIATFLQRDVRTVKRWEKSEGLPVHRHQHLARSSVYAFASELETWRAHRRPADEPEPAWFDRQPARILALAATALLLLLSAGNGFAPSLATAAQGPGITVRQVWSGPTLDPTTAGISPDGRFLSYVDWLGDGDMFLLDLTTGQARKLTKILDPGWDYAQGSAFSPDGRQIAYAWYHHNSDKPKESRWEVRILGLEAATGDAPRVLCALEGVDARVAAWSRDGKGILALSTREDRTKQIVVVSVQDGSLHVLKTLDRRSAGRMTFSPDSRFIAYDFPQREGAEDRDIFLLSVDGVRETRLVNHPANDVLLGWEPEGKRILFASNRTGTISAWALPFADGEAAQAPDLVKQEIGQIWPLGFAGKGAYYYGVDTSTLDVFLAAFDPATNSLAGKPAPLNESLMRRRNAPDWSPDGKYLAYRVEKLSMPVGPRTWRIVIRSMETGAERELSTKVRFYEVRWSPDARSFLLTGNDDKNRFGIHVIRAETGLVTTMLPNAYWGEWSRDGNLIFYAQNPMEGNGIRRLMIRDLAAGQDRVLFTPKRKADGGVGLSHAVSPDGRLVAFSAFEAEPKNAILQVIPATGGEARELLRLSGSGVNFGGVAWSADGRQIFFNKRSQQSNELWVVPLEGGEARSLGVALRTMTQLSAHPDGRLAFDAGESKSELWVMENFLPSLKASK